MSRTYRKYTDLDAVFAANPVTGDLSLRKDESAVKFAIKNLVLTKNFERPFDSSIGSQVSNLLFSPMDETTVIVMKQAIAQTIENHEPRVDIIDIDVKPKYDGNEISINIVFKIKNTEKPLNVTFALDRTR